MSKPVVTIVEEDVLKEVGSGVRPVWIENVSYHQFNGIRGVEDDVRRECVSVWYPVEDGIEEL